MGYMLHHFMVVESWNSALINVAHAKALEIFGRPVSEILESTTNNVRSFYVPPDGSKEGWGESAEGDDRRARFAAWCREQAHEDGSTSLKWVEVALGADSEEDTKIVSAWKNTGERGGRA